MRPHEGLTGEPPFERDSELAVLFAHLHELAPRVTDVRPDLPEGLDRVVRTAMAKAPGERFASCGAVIDAARGALAGRRRRRRRVPPALAAVAALASCSRSPRGRVRAAAARTSARRRAAAGGGRDAASRWSTRAGRRVAGRIALPEVPTDVVFARALRVGRPARRVAHRADRRPAPHDGRHGPAAVPCGRDRAPARGAVRDATGRSGRRPDRDRDGEGHGAVERPERGRPVSDPTGIAAGAGSVWLARGAEVVRVDARTGRVQRRYPLPITATLLTFAGGELWAASSENGLVEKIDPDSDRIAARATLQGWMTALTVADGAAWAAVSPATASSASTRTTPAWSRPSRPAGSAEPHHPRGRPVGRRRASAGADPHRPASGARRALALAGRPDRRPRAPGAALDRRRAAAAPPPPASRADDPRRRPRQRDRARPGVGPFPAASQLQYATCMKLLDYPDAAGAAGRRLVPEAAAALPALSADGRTYTLRIRRGLRFSPPSGAPLTATRSSARSSARSRRGSGRIRPACTSPATSSAPRPTTPGAPSTCAASSRGATRSRSRSRGPPATCRRGSRCRSSAPSRAARRSRAAPGLLPSAGPYYARSRTATRSSSTATRTTGARAAAPGAHRLPHRGAVGEAVALADGGQADVVAVGLRPARSAGARRALDGASVTTRGRPP